MKCERITKKKIEDEKVRETDIQVLTRETVTTAILKVNIGAFMYYYFSHGVFS